MKYKQWLGAVLAGIILLGLLAGCNLGTKPLPEGMEATKVEEIAQNALTIMNAREYEALSKLFPVGSITAEQWEQSLQPIFDKFGAFKEFGQTQIMGDEKDGEKFAVALVECKYENGKGIFSVSMNTQYQVMGIWLVG